jgi:hemoglobin-like flavoprotein
MTTPAFRDAALIEQSLELFAERCEDPTPLVYQRLFAANPAMAELFWRDSNGAIKGEMLSRVFSAILDFVGDRRYADLMIGTEMITHEGYDVPREVFATFFAVVAETARDTLGPDWTPAMAAAWRDMLAEIDAFARKVPVVAG